MSPSTQHVRYGDGCNVHVRSQRAGDRVMESIARFLTTKARLKVNRAKSAVARPRERKFLGFSFTGGREPRRRIVPKAVARFKERVRELTRRTRGVSMAQRARELSAYLRGWQGYFGFCQTSSVLEGLEQWLRRPLRSALWKQWKRGKKRYTPSLIPAEPVPAPAPRNAVLGTGEQATIGKSLVIKGEVTGSEPLYIDGRVEGSISLAGNRVTVGRDGVVAADIEAGEIVVLGKVSGNLVAGDRVDIRSEGSLTGDVVAQRISIEDGAFFKGGIDIRKADRKTDGDAKQVPATEGKATAGR